MSSEKLYKACETFEKLAQQKFVPQNSDVNFWSKLLHNAIISYANMFPSPEAATKVFGLIAKHNSSPAYYQDKEKREVQAIGEALSQAALKLQDAGLDPLIVLQRRGMQNLNPNIINILTKNIKIMENAKEGVDLRSVGYQHYTLPRAGQPNPKDIIDLDIPEPGKGPGY